MDLGAFFGGNEEERAIISHKFAIFKEQDVGLAAAGDFEMQVRLVSKHALWGDHLWNASRWLSCQFLRMDLQGLTMVELGAGAGLTSLIAGKRGASRVVVTDYPDPELIENLTWNIHQQQLEQHVVAVGYRWGDSVEPLLALNGMRRFDRVLLCDLVFNHSEHAKLLRSLGELLIEGGLAYCVFTHYRPWLAEKDMDFLRLAGEQGWKVERIAEHVMPAVMFEADRGDPLVRRTVHAFTLAK